MIDLIHEYKTFVNISRYADALCW